jgi:hypothetical protein
MRRKNREELPVLALILNSLQAKKREVFPLFARDALPPRADNGAARRSGDVINPILPVSDRHRRRQETPRSGNACRGAAFTGEERDYFFGSAMVMLRYIIPPVWSPWM